MQIAKTTTHGILIVQFSPIYERITVLSRDTYIVQAIQGVVQYMYYVYLLELDAKCFVRHCRNHILNECRFHSVVNFKSYIPYKNMFHIFYKTV